MSNHIRLKKMPTIGTLSNTHMYSIGIANNCTGYKKAILYKTGYKKAVLCETGYKKPILFKTGYKKAILYKSSKGYWTYL